MRRDQVVTATIILLLTVSLIPITSGVAVAAAVTDGQSPMSPLQQSPSENGINVTTEYPTSDSSQAIGVTTTVSPTEAEITNVSLRISNSQNAFIDYDSFSLSLDPSGAAEVEEDLRMRNGNQVKIYQIDSLQTDETVTITFNAYPRQLQSEDETLDVATVRYEFLRNGIQVPDDSPGQISAVADISESPQYEAQRLNSRVSNLWLTVGASVAVGVVGLVVGAVVYLKNRNSGSSISRSRLRSIADDAEKLQRRLSARGDEEGAADAEDISEALNDLRR